MTTLNNEDPADPSAHEPRELLYELRHEEALLAVRGPQVGHGSIRQVRLKDAAALRAVLAYFDQP